MSIPTSLLGMGFRSAVSKPGKYISIPAAAGAGGYLAGHGLTGQRGHDSSKELSARKNFEGKRLGLSAGLGAAGTMIPGIVGGGVKSRLLGALLGAGAGYAMSSPFDPDKKVRVIREPGFAQGVADRGRTGLLGNRATDWVFDESYLRRFNKL